MYQCQYKSAWPIGVDGKHVELITFTTARKLAIMIVNPHVVAREKWSVPAR